MDFIHKLVTAATQYPITPAEAREQIEVGDDSFDAKFDIWIPAATRDFERMTRRAMLPQTWLVESEDAVREIELPRPPIIEVISVKSKDRLEDEWVDVDEADYVVQLNRSPSRITWLDTQPRFIQVTYTAGHATADDVPADYKDSILQLIALKAENRGDVDYRMPIALKAHIASQQAGTRLGFFTD
jgi:uncharacterized phiE125 gp8 family phage protein